MLEDCNLGRLYLSNSKLPRCAGLVGDLVLGNALADWDSTAPQWLRADSAAPETTSMNTTVDGINCFCAKSGDRASGKHYRASNCEGARAASDAAYARHVNSYRFSGQCAVDEDKRNHCRSVD